MDRIIAVDTGKYMTKSALRRADGTDKLLEFRTKMDEAEVALGQGGAEGVHFVEYGCHNCRKRSGRGIRRRSIFRVGRSL